MLKLLLYSCVIGLTTVSGVSAQNPVIHYGTMRSFMQQGDLHGKVWLDTLPDTEHLYGLGVAEGMRGEILILDGQAITTRVAVDSSLQTEQGFKGAAALLVTTNVEGWDTLQIPQSITNISGLEHFIALSAAASGLDTSSAFVFRLAGRAVEAHWHVMDWPEGLQGHTAQNHKEYAVPGTTVSEEVVVLGFFSRSHTGVFIHHRGATHLHIQMKKSGIVAHVDSMNPSGLKLLLPTTQPFTSPQDQH